MSDNQTTFACNDIPPQRVYTALLPDELECYLYADHPRAHGVFMDGQISAELNAEAREEEYQQRILQLEQEVRNLEDDQPPIADWVGDLREHVERLRRSPSVMTRHTAVKLSRLLHELEGWL